MASEPQSLGDRLRQLEERVRTLEIDMLHARAAEALSGDVFEHVLMPSILLIAGYGHRDMIAGMLRRAAEAHAGQRHVDKQLREGAVEMLDGWRNWIESTPDWSPPSFDDRHPSALT